MFLCRNDGSHLLSLRFGDLILMFGDLVLGQHGARFGLVSAEFAGERGLSGVNPLMLD